ncbi:MAG: vitamin K-dependent gamma-carboxylase [Saprospiraceae bacterium]|jgi:vitamin K-dependent gamma-carboxylase
MSFNKVSQFLTRQIDIATLVLFRIAFGLIMTWEVCRYFSNNWIYEAFCYPRFHFSYEGFSWVNAWPGNGPFIHFFILGLCSLFITIGFLYRIASALFFLGFSYIFLIDQGNYLNHFYLIILISFIMIFLPANKSFSVDAKIFPKIKTDWAPNWTVWWLKIQLGITYFFGGIAKINSDWLQGEPLRSWISRGVNDPIFGLFTTNEWFIYTLSYGGLLLDLLAFPLLLSKKTRIPTTIALLLFHLFNAYWFQIGIFPWFMIAATAIFYPPESLRFWEKKQALAPSKFRLQKWALWGLGIYMSAQILVPFRHLLYDGNVSWTEEGHRFSWHMKLRDKDCDTQFLVADMATNDVYNVDLTTFLTERQIRKMSNRPVMIIQFAHYLSDNMSKKLNRHASVFVTSSCSLNGRPAAELIDSEVDLSKVEYPFYKKADWIIPLEVPLN